jgi:16S rRNA (cytosine967-C5)-methyltransferase
VDARWRLQKGDLENLVKIQREILEKALPCLKPGGRIVYSTCSIDPEENIEQVKRFIGDHSGLVLGDWKQVLPFEDQCDGAFAAVIKSQEDS